ncbi:hypothetical protein GCK72_001263 [Caenorhabditis remanei]|uniref:Uncharacterized protein n=2 Tax=Caenorhabditis remanei TaxID=31234 RepID=E3LXH9_CAERE|nr:hypothetical protein GCK72_001263 [Caenorhabditis remanei]EFO84665.1 hypothetical protein CRE_03656 [Caenorhabditis remanei]KAF1769446.1 hypothetical protein GCK72_001263 [Caenorhabditis remanei]
MSSEKQNKDITLQTQEEGAKTFQLDKTQLDEIPEEKKSERSQNCATWSQNLLKSKKFSKMTQEYRDNKEFKPNVSTTVSENRMDKNRYNHILCADENRVVLKERDPSNDYIHASWMKMPDGVQFISTQGPIKETIADFWHMVYTEKCSAIVMLCQYTEDEKEKCHKYYSRNSEKLYGDYKVKVMKCWDDVFKPVKLTIIEIQKKNSPITHRVRHYWYYDWRDQVAPLDTAPLRKLYKAVLEKSDSKPIVVHCSAGVGRTATFIGIHLAYVMIRESPAVEMVDVMKRLRKMRLGAIQSQLQYVFLIMCLLGIFIEEKVYRPDKLYEGFQQRYSDVTRKVTKAIMEEEKQKQDQQKKEEEREEKEREKEKEWEKNRDREREKAKEKRDDKKDDREAPALREDKRREKNLESPSKPLLRRDPPSRPSRKLPNTGEEKTSRDNGSKYENSLAEERSRNKQKSVYVKWPLSSKEKRSKHERQKPKLTKNTNRKKKRPTSNH